MLVLGFVASTQPTTFLHHFTRVTPLEISVFKGGDFTNLGDDKPENWVFKGNTQQQDRIVRFISSSWTCLCQNGKNVGSVDIWWGDTAGDAAWACNQWISSCNGECTAEPIQG
ncbi:MAG: hypothetical protein ACRAVC_08270 [Trichormus sp.]